MANPEHLAKLKQGVEVWNRWREEHPYLRPDLSGGMLRNRVLDSADLSGANLRDINFRRTSLSGASLRGSKLYRVYFSKTRLDDTDFEKAILYETVFANVDLGRTKNLETCVHKGPSILDHRTIGKSGKLPRVFLEGCGLPESWITQAIKSDPGTSPYRSCFISYSSIDEDFAGRLHADLQGNGVRCWFAPEEIKIGDKIRDTIDQFIRDYDKLLIVLSENSIESQWVEDEVESALEKERSEGTVALFPIRLDDAAMDSTKAWAAKIGRQRHIGDFTDWKNHDSYKKAFERLLRDLKAQD